MSNNDNNKMQFLCAKTTLLSILRRMSSKHAEIIIMYFEKSCQPSCAGAAAAHRFVTRANLPHNCFFLLVRMQKTMSWPPSLLLKHNRNERQHGRAATARCCHTARSTDSSRDVTSQDGRHTGRFPPLPSSNRIRSCYSVIII